MPYAQLPALRSELQTVLSQVQSDLTEAQKLQSKLAKTTS